MSRSFHIEDDLQRQRLLQWLGNHRVPFQVDVGPIREQRSLSQNSRLWALHSLAARHTGHSAEEMHEFALMRHFGTKEIEMGGMRRQIPLKRSSTREKAEFAHFMEDTESWYATEFGIWLGQEEAA